MCVRYLLQEGACLSLVNCDGDVPLDIAEDEAMEALLQEYTLKQGESMRYTDGQRERQKALFTMSSSSPTQQVMQ